MAKMRKSQLKEIVKECLVEILSEGLSSNSQAADILTSKMSSKKVNEGLAHSKKPAVRRKTALDSISYGESPRLDNAIENSVSTLTSDPIMQSIFSDTARTTLQEQLASESHGPSPASQTASDSASLAMSQSDPMDIFSESANNWATLAFSDPASKSGQ